MPNIYYEAIKEEINGCAASEFFPCMMDEERYWMIKGKLALAKQFDLIPYEQRLELFELMNDIMKTDSERLMCNKCKEIVNLAENEGIKYLSWTHEKDSGAVYFTKQFERCEGESSCEFVCDIDLDDVLNNQEYVIEKIKRSYKTYTSINFDDDWEEVVPSPMNI